MKHVLSEREYENAFACFPRIVRFVTEADGSLVPEYQAGKCPQTNGPMGCPRWVEIAGTNIATGEDDIRAGCDAVTTNHANVVVLQSNGRIVASLDKTATVLHTGFNRVYDSMRRPKLMPKIKEVLRLK
jgi:hypothetical protein